jgi:hypothetical protein
MHSGTALVTAWADYAGIGLTAPTLLAAVANAA